MFLWVGEWISMFLYGGFVIRFCVRKNGCLHSKCVTDLSRGLSDGKIPRDPCILRLLSEAFHLVAAPSSP